MRNSLFTVLVLLSFFAFSQEFQTYENGLIYSPYAMERLKTVVGEKNEEFKVCDLTKVYRSLEQTKGRVFVLTKPSLNQLKTDLLNNISVDAFVKKYGISNNFKPLLLTKSHYLNYKGKQVVGIREQPTGNTLEILESSFEKSKKGLWIWDFSNSEYVYVTYLEKEFSSKDLPDRYARMILYSECLIDTTSQIFNEGASKNRWFSHKKESRVKMEKFNSYILQRFGKEKPATYPNEDLSRDEMLARFDSLKRWEKSKKMFVKNELSKDPIFCKLLNEAYNEALKNKNSNNEFEEYVSFLLSTENALELKRNRVVVGQCSMDNSPRIHAMNIAQLAGESLNWDIFLRAHLNVLNDYFNRASDGSYAWEARQTYIKELEELDINVPELIFGTAFRSKNVAENHYFGNIGRMGRAIAESKDVSIFEDELPLMVSDKNLDDYNRLLMFYLYDNFSYQKNGTHNKLVYNKNREKMLAFLPEYLQKSVQEN
ncbi:hypothetical protein [Flagellimonas sp. 2504JD1-5]